MVHRETYITLVDNEAFGSLLSEMKRKVFELGIKNRKFSEKPHIISSPTPTLTHTKRN